MRVLVTGGGSDIGLAIVQRRLALGDEVIITGSSRASLDQALARFHAREPAAADQAPRKLSGLVFDLRQPEASADAIAAVLERGVDGLVLNAWTRRPPVRRFHEMRPGSVAEDMQANVLGNCWLIQRLLPGMLARRFGRIVLISSISTANGTSRYGTYVMGKAALEGLVRNLAMDYGPDNVLANTVRLGMFRTERTSRFWTQVAYVTHMNNVIPQGALGEPAQVGPALDPLLSEQQYVNGAMLDVSGGLPMFRLDGALRS